MSSVSEDESSDNSSEDYSEASSEVLEENFHLASEEYLPYDENIEPIATEQEAAVYADQVAQEEEEETILWSRFSGEDAGENWCKCSNCSLEFVVKVEECRCCMEVDRCREWMEEVEMNACVTMHPGFTDVCLNRWVLRTAGIGFKTNKNKSYSAMLAHSDTAEHKFLRSVAYRQFVRMVWGYIGASKRYPLPCCVYNSIRRTYPTEAKQNYQGYEEDE